jgi:hypothetical protein
LLLSFSLLSKSREHKKKKKKVSKEKKKWMENGKTFKDYKLDSIKLSQADEEML